MVATDPPGQDQQAPLPEESPAEVALREGPPLHRKADRTVRGMANLGREGFEIIRRVAVGTYNDGLIHAGNLAYLAVLAIFPFFILGAATFTFLGEEGERAAMIDTVLVALPPVVANVISPVAHDVVELRSGWLLWAGGLVGLWTVGSLIETIRDILHRAYRVQLTEAFWKYRLVSTAMIIAAVVLLMLSLIVQVLIGATQQVIDAHIPNLANVASELSVSRLIPALGLYASLYLLFYTLTPQAFRSRRFPKWPGAVLVTVWWIVVTLFLPPLLRGVFTYNLTYGSLAGIMITLFFFWLVGLGMVMGAELNAALAGSSGGVDGKANRVGPGKRTMRHVQDERLEGPDE